MKLLMVPSWFPTADKPWSGSFFKEQAGALARRGHQVAVAYADLRFALHGLPTGIFFEPGNTPVYLCRRRSLTPFWEAGRAPQRARMLTALYRRVEREWGRPDVVLLESCLQGPETVWLSRRENLPLAYVEHYSGVLLAAHESWPHKARPLCRELRAGLGGCDSVGAVSAALRDAMRSVLPGASGAPEIGLVPNAVDIFRFTPPAAPPNGPFTFGAMGNFVPLKGFATLLRAFALVRQETPSALLALAGDGPEEARLRALAEALGIAGAVRFRGRVPRQDAPSFFHDCHCFVCSSHIETFGVALTEALSCGLPVVATRCGGPAEIVGPWDGCLCPPGDPSALARAMLTVLQNPQRFDPSAIHTRCAARFSEDAVCGRLKALCEQAVRRHAEQSKNGLS